MRPIPRCIWGPTEIGAVGLTEDEARGAGRKVRVGKFDFQASGAAQAMGHGIGFAKVVGDSDTGEILGVHIVGEHATDLVGLAVAVMTMEGVVEDIARAIMPHPTLSEAIMEAALDWNGLAVHGPKKQGR
jgi:dihydrolipoamide dehydrogenase